MDARNVRVTEWIRFLAIFPFAFPIVLYAQKTSPYQFSLEQLGHIQVYTASRSMTLVEKAPSIVTVITAEEIRQRGYKNLQDVLERVVGFVAFADNFDQILGQRGFVEDGNHEYLFMIDGHPVNNQIDYSLGHDQIIPSLGKVRQIEILHTPGSTLWGADAAGGIVNVITYDGKDIDFAGNKFGSFMVSADYEIESRRHFQNLIYGKRFSENSDLMLSLNRSESSGDLLPAYHAGEDGLVEWSQGRPWDPRANAENIFGPAYDFYAKYHVGGLTVLANHINSFYISNFNTPIDDSANSGHYRYVSYGEASYTLPINESLGMETGIFYDDFMDKTKGGFVNAIGPPVGYTGIGGSSILSYQKMENRIKFGMQYDRRFFETNSFYQPPLEAKVENVYGIFSEDEYSGIKNTILTLGIRYDYNDLRAPGGKLYPRAAAIYGFSEDWSAKYTYNSGYVRPLYGQIRGIDNIYQAVKDGAPWIGPHKSQKSESHDLQLNYNKGGSHAALTLYKMVIHDFSTYIGYTAFGNPDTNFYGYEYIHQNVGDVNSLGIEFEASHRISNAWTVYGNSAYVKPKLSDSMVTLAGGIHTINIVTEPDMDLVNHDLEKVGFPQLIWNFGIDWNPLKNQFVNIHHRGWTENPVKVKRNPNTYDYFGPEGFLDMNYTWSSIGADGLDLGVYAKNVLDNNPNYPSPNDGGYVVNNGRSFGMNIKYKL